VQFAKDGSHKLNNARVSGVGTLIMKGTVLIFPIYSPGPQWRLSWNAGNGRPTIWQDFIGWLESIEQLRLQPMGRGDFALRVKAHELRIPQDEELGRVSPKTDPEAAGLDAHQIERATT